MDNEKTNPGLTDQGISEIDKALQAARARKAKRGENTAAAVPAQKAEKPARAPKATDEEKAAKKAAREQERQAQKEARAQAREAKRAERQASKGPAHMAKVERAAARLPSLSRAAQTEVQAITAGFSAGEVAAIAAHLQHFNRQKATERSIGRQLTVGQRVRITGGEGRYIGREGTVAKAQKIRAYIDVGEKKPLYVFIADVESLESANRPAKTA